jgi:dihydrofolate reductase
MASIDLGIPENGTDAWSRWKVNMAKLTYSMLTSLDGYTEDEHGRFGWGAPEDEEVHPYINQLVASYGTYLFGRRMYETFADQ